MARPRIPDEDRRDHDFRLRLNESDAMALRRKAKMLGLAPTALAMVIIHSKINGVDDSIKFSIAC